MATPLNSIQFYTDLKATRRVVPRGIPGIVLILGVGAMTIWGHWVSVQSYKKKCKYQEEEVFRARVNILPIYTAEQDREYLKSRKRMIELEEKYCKDIPQFVVGGTVYHTRWLPPPRQVEGNW
eukprot:TRINITY_DN17396_c0_g1_i1.p1 TRINITY_DN17396_c0_g1~~TRINITY_DN17396_c0_g1_i1.p1  ORF type:complete len:123 (+),score=10.40 TRINITY_DN17396_c0_g1_i1:103-471(+)